MLKPNIHKEFLDILDASWSDADAGEILCDFLEENSADINSALSFIAKEAVPLPPNAARSFIKRSGFPEQVDFVDRIVEQFGESCLAVKSSLGEDSRAGNSFLKQHEEIDNIRKAFNTNPISIINPTNHRYERYVNLLDKTIEHGTVIPLSTPYKKSDAPVEFHTTVVLLSMRSLSFSGITQRFIPVKKLSFLKPSLVVSFVVSELDFFETYHEIDISFDIAKDAIIISQEMSIAMYFAKKSGMSDCLREAGREANLVNRIITSARTRSPQ